MRMILYLAYGGFCGIKMKLFIPEKISRNVQGKTEVLGLGRVIGGCSRQLDTWPMKNRY